MITQKVYVQLRKNFMKKNLLLSPLVREGMEVEDIKDFADAIEKVVYNISDL